MGDWLTSCPYLVDTQKINSGQTLEFKPISVKNDEDLCRIKQIFWEAKKTNDDGTEEIIPVSLVYKNVVTENFECMHTYKVAFHNHSGDDGYLSVYVMKETYIG